MALRTVRGESEPPADWTTRGSSPRIVGNELYTVRHEMRHLPGQRTRQAFIDAAVDKRFVLHMLCDIDGDRARENLRDALFRNGCIDPSRVRAFLGALDRTLRAGSYVVVAYDAALAETTLKVENGRSVTVAGADFMRAVWATWLGPFASSQLAQSLVGRAA
jgi:hypothetical protein